VQNLLPHEIREVVADVCLSISHLPGEPDWCNRDFMPDDVPLSREAQGLAWFERIAPRNLMALTHDGWVDMHPFPDAPDATRLQPYDHTESPDPCALGCAVEAPGGGLFLFQAWRSPAYFSTCFYGNACTHLWPVVAPAIPPGASATVAGLVGIFFGSRDEVGEHIRTFALNGRRPA
jgi:hypothetical protein